MLGEPLLLGLLVAPSWAGLGIGVAALGAFLAHHPLKLALADGHRRSVHRRTLVASAFAILYGTVGALGLSLASKGHGGWWVPLAAAAPLALAQLAYDARLRGRQLLPETLGAVALGSVAAAEMRSAGLPLGASLAAWGVLAGKAVGAVLYVRARLRLDRGLPSGRAAPLVSHAAALVLTLLLVRAHYVPWLVACAFALLLARAIHGLSRFHRRTRPRMVGIQEMAFGLAFVVIAALGYTLGF
jgi:YwiC-like protein